MKPFPCSLNWAVYDNAKTEDIEKAVNTLAAAAKGLKLPVVINNVIYHKDTMIKMGHLLVVKSFKTRGSAFAFMCDKHWGKQETHDIIDQAFAMEE